MEEGESDVRQPLALELLLNNLEDSDSVMFESVSLPKFKRSEESSDKVKALEDENRNLREELEESRMEIKALTEEKAFWKEQHDRISDEYNSLKRALTGEGKLIKVRSKSARIIPGLTK